MLEAIIDDPVVLLLTVSFSVWFCDWSTVCFPFGLLGYSQPAVSYKASDRAVVRR